MNEKQEEVAQQIEAAIRDEEDDINEYRRAAMKADPKTKKLLTHIMKQEKHHKKELRNRLKQIK